MAVNKVVYSGKTLIDLSSDTVTPETLAKGVTAHDKTGAAIVGTYEGSAEDLGAVLTEQEQLIASLRTALQGKAAGGGDGTEPVIEPLEVTENGTYTAPSGVDGYSPVTVNVPVPEGYIKPSGTLEITENGTHDAEAYEAVSVNVPVPDGYIQPSGTKEITENGTHDVKAYESVNVNVLASGGGAQVARGTFNPAENISGANKAIAAITGLGFRPSYVLIAARATAYTLINNTNSSGGYGRFVVFAENDGTTKRSGYLYKEYWSGTDLSETYAKIVFTDDGFEFSTGSAADCYVSKHMMYHYVAIG